MSDLPSVYANKIDYDLKNNEDYYYGTRENQHSKDLTLLKKYFDKSGYANKLNVLIKTKNGNKLEKLILCKDSYFVNINNEKISFEDILDYQIK